MTAHRKLIARQMPQQHRKSSNWMAVRWQSGFTFRWSRVGAVALVAPSSGFEAFCGAAVSVAQAAGANFSVNTEFWFSSLVLAAPFPATDCANTSVASAVARGKVGIPWLCLSPHSTELLSYLSTTTLFPYSAALVLGLLISLLLLLLLSDTDWCCRYRSRSFPRRPVSKWHSSSWRRILISRR